MSRAPGLPARPSWGPGRPESPAPRGAESARRRAARRGRRRDAVSLSGGDRAYAGVMQERDHDLIVEPLRPAQREVDHQVDVLAPTGLALDREARAPHHRLE